jgi:hypothetical protein
MVYRGAKSHAVATAIKVPAKQIISHKLLTASTGKKVWFMVGSFMSVIAPNR